ncbi:MAG: RNA polymerase factor sigma-54 [Spirochaetaceae bacterium]|jgi:RNA polymerase sigma-54 factor|nr:RNA polymerase factor sigma-54 [Spirochaetaceae bacterium]
MQQLQKIGISQDIRLSQTINAQVLQAIKIMELPVFDLRNKIAEELEKNPALEIIKDKSTVSLESLYKKPREEKEYFDSTSDSGYVRSGYNATESDEHRNLIEGILSQNETLQDYLLQQLDLAPIDDLTRSAGKKLIQNIDSDGFNITSPQELFNKNEYSKKVISKAMSLIQSFDPQGCCTDNYTESLAVQAKIKYPSDFNGIKEILPFLENAHRKKFAEIAHAVKITKQEVELLFDKIKTLDPFPGRNYACAGESCARFVIPDVYVKRKEDEFVIVLNNEEIPVLGIQPFFMKQTKAKGKQDERDFVKENLNEARWFINSINRRNHTLLRVTRVIVELQKDFFITGPKHLIPLTMQSVADALGTHVATISRTVNGKYVQTEWGVFELRYFFTNSISGNGVQASRYSQESVKEIIAEIISNEKRQLSDLDISEMLAKQGIPLARRTVAKYRKQLDLGSSYSRQP